jgi:hypothetical protein
MTTPLPNSSKTLVHAPTRKSPEDKELGTCHAIWERQKEILKREHDITWYISTEMNPRVIFD